MCFFAFAFPPLIGDHLHWWIPLVVVVLGMAIFGRDELRRLSLGRIVAISSVCFAESLRRRVLWVTPLAIIGVIVLTLLQHPVDQQEAIRQTIKFCLFASGTLVTITAIILACTNLPREIESRVIFTIVTKPTTRLEIVLGKVLGFVRVSGLIVLIMGVFSLVFLEWQDWKLNGQIARQLQSESDKQTHGVLAGYQAAGLLNTKSLDDASEFQIHNHLPEQNEVETIEGGQFYMYAVPFSLSSDDEGLLDPATEDPPRAQVLVINTLRIKRNVPTKEQMTTIETRKLPVEGKVFGPALKSPMPLPQLSFSILNRDRTVIVSPTEINNGHLTNFPHSGNEDAPYTVGTPLTPDQVRTLLNAREFSIDVNPETPSVDYFVSQTPTVLLVIDATGNKQMIKATGPPRFISHVGKYGMQITGNPRGTGSAADFRFDNVSVPQTSGPVTFRVRVGLIRGGDYDPNKEWSSVGLRIFNRGNGKLYDLIEFHPETNRDMPVPVPGEELAGGNFDVYVQGLDNGQWVGLTASSVQLISAEHGFVVNLVKSLLILWLFSVLVVIVAVFTSTFLSWPIAIVLTLLILLGNWGVTELGDALNSPGRNVAADLGFGRDAAKSNVVSESVNKLAKMLTAISSVLPDLSKFPVMDDVTRGVSIPPRRIIEAISVLLSYGLPMLVVSFIILKNKEVAP